MVNHAEWVFVSSQNETNLLTTFSVDFLKVDCIVVPVLGTIKLVKWNEEAHGALMRDKTLCLARGK